VSRYADDRPAAPAGRRTLPGYYYTDRDHFERELERLHLAMWLYAGRSESLEEPGSFLLCEVAGESAIVLRDASGALRGHHNVCRHRGTRICSADGRLPGHIRCPYHGWTYGLDGELLGAPHMERTEGFRREHWPLKPVAVDTWDGHVFVSFSEAPEPLAGHLGSLVERFRPWQMERLRCAERRRYDVGANWKLVIQNYSECLHCPVAHPLLSSQSHYMSGDNEPAQPTWLGGRMELREGVASLTRDGSSSRHTLPGLSAEDRRRVYYYAILPNLLLNLHPDYALTFSLWPLSPDRTRIVCEWLFDPDEMERPGFDPMDAVEFWEITNREDWALSDQAQRGIASRAYEPGPYSSREELLWALDALVLERTGE
jgi:Rieske 2Fe-2S family protein